MAKKQASSFLTVVLIILLLLVMTLTLILGLYKMERYKVLNEFIDNVISRFIDVKSGPVIEEIEVKEISRIRVAAGSVLHKTPFFLGEMTGSNELNSNNLRSLEYETTESDIAIQISSDYKTLTVTGMLQRLDPLYDGYDESVSSWTLHTEYPILTRPCLFQDCIVFIDASPSLIMVNVLTGTASSGQYVPFFPDNKASAVNQAVQAAGTDDSVQEIRVPLYTVLGRDGKIYAFAFSDAHIEAPASASLSVSSSIFTPDDKALEHMVSIIKNWAGFTEDPVLGAPLILSDDYSPLLMNLQSASFVVFMVPASGNYTAGLTDENGLFIRDNAVVCIFTGSGELIGVSVDYESDRPNVTSYFEEKKLYYVLAAAQAGSSIDTSYFSIKQAVK